MRDRQDATIGGILETPDGFWVCGADFDADEPYIKICDNLRTTSKETKILVPKSLAYYLSTHWCGSEKMHKEIVNRTTATVKSQIREALGL
jgi:hypothetical protein